MNFWRVKMLLLKEDWKWNFSNERMEKLKFLDNQYIIFFSLLNLKYIFIIFDPENSEEQMKFNAITLFPYTC